jgi:DNA-binding MarR family transcriptional regulator
MSAEPGIEILNLVNAIERRTTARMQRLLREAGLGLAAMEARTLRFVARHPGCTQNEIVRASGRDKAQIARIIKTLRERGLVERPADGGGRRAQPLALTSAGAAVHARAESLRADTARELVGGLEPDERGRLEALLGRLSPLAPVGED